jgi:hypothetical protein
MNLANVIQDEECKVEYQPPMFEVIDIAIEQNILAGSGDVTDSNALDFYGEDY